jgi:hypothetical protein
MEMLRQKDDRVDLEQPFLLAGPERLAKQLTGLTVGE